MDEKIDVLKLMENVIYLKKYTLFAALSTEELRALSLIARELSVGDNACVVREDDAGDSFFIIKRGALRIVKGSGEKAVELSVLPQNAPFGEMALFEEGALRSASAYAKGDSTLLVFHRDDLFEAMTKYPGIAFELLKIFGNRLREVNAKVQALSKESKS